MLAKPRLLLGVKLLVSGGLIYFLLSQVGWQELLVKAEDVSRPLLLLAFLIVIAQFPISTMKWSKSLQQHDIHFGYWYLQTVSCIGYFLNNFLPTGIGGDAYRILRTLPKSGRRSRAVSASFLDRIVGLCALLLMGYSAAVYLWLTSGNAMLNTLVPLATAGLCVLVPAFFFARYMGVIKRIEQHPKVGEKLLPLTENLRLILRPGANLWVFIALSFLFQITAIVLLSVLFKASNLDVSLVQCAIIIAVGGVVVMLPISIAGIGVYEGALVGTAVAIGLPAEPAVIASVLLRLLTVPMSLACGVVFMTSSLKPAASAAESN